MSEQTRFEKILKDADKVYDEEMLPLIIDEVKSNFKDSVRQGQKFLIQYKKDELNIMMNADNFDVDSLAESRRKRKVVEEKIEIIEELYQELFNESLM